MASTLSVEGTWTIEALIDENGEALLSESERGELRLRFDDGTVTGPADCNEFGASYRQSADGEDLAVDPDSVTVTDVGCPEEGPPVLQRLEAVRYVSTHGDDLYLHAGNRMITMVLSRVTEPPSDDELDRATSAARLWLVGQDATVTGASVRAKVGVVEDSNTGRPCMSGRLLEVKLDGSFPEIAIGGTPAAPGERGPDMSAAAVVLTVDAASGVTCLIWRPDLRWDGAPTRTRLRPDRGGLTGGSQDHHTEHGRSSAQVVHVWKAVQARLFAS